MKLEDGILYLEGAADQEWISSLQEAVAVYPEIDAVDIRALVNLTEATLIKRIVELENESVFFDVSTSYDFDSVDAPKLTSLVKGIIDLSRELSRQVQIVVRGHSDSVGKFEDNQFLSIERADYVAQLLFITGISPKYIVIKGLEVQAEREINEAEERYNRRVSFEVIVE